MFKLTRFAFSTCIALPFATFAANRHIHSAVRGHCATAAYMRTVNQSLGQGPEAEKAKAELAASARRASHQAAKPRARTWVTPHFAIRYALFGINQVKLVAADTALIRRIGDAQKATLSLVSAIREAAVYRYLDSVQAPHPVYAQEVMRIFEDARAYYVDTLKMRAPQGISHSMAYDAESASGDRFTVDIADIGSYDSPSYKYEPYYGLTLPPPQLAIVLENDFLWNASLDSDGTVRGDTVESLLNGRVVHNYAREYGLGLSVTIYHEFYHAIQFSYLSGTGFRTYHAWYELSAVGMEERKVPESNDYLQYLPCLFESPGQFGLFATGARFCNPEASYSNAPFHLFLTKAVGENFDTRVWENLSGNGDVIQKALPLALSQMGSSLAKTFPAYAANLLLAGRAAGQDQFSSDMPEWPSMQADSLSPDQPSLSFSQTLPPLAYLPLKLPKVFQAGRITADFGGDSSAALVRIHGDSLVIEPYTGSQALLAPQIGEGEKWLVMTNLNPNSNEVVSVKTTQIPFLAYPNPVSKARDNRLRFARSSLVTYPVKVEVASETGETVFSQVFASLDSIADWTLLDTQKRAVKPGIYHLRVNQKPWETLVLLP